MSDADFETNAVTTSAAAKMDEIAAQLTRETHSSTPIDLIPDLADRQRAQLIPFRGNPADVKAVKVGGETKLYVALGGDVMNPGNEVAVVARGQVRSRIKVGIRPQRLAVHPAGLVFVCNQYSNYVSIIDPQTDQLLSKGGQPVEIKTEHLCADLVFVPRDRAAADVDRQLLYVANRWRHSVLEYAADVVRDPLTNRPVDVIQSAAPNPSPANQPLAEILGVGNHPWRLALSEAQDSLYVVTNRGGEVARVDLRTGLAASRVTLGAPSIDVVNIQDLLFVPTTTPDRGLLYRDEPHPQQVIAPPVFVRGLDGASHQAHPGALFDSTRSYNFEDLRNGIQALDFRLQASQPLAYFTDDVSAEPNFLSAQKVLAGALPQAVVRNQDGTRVFVAMGGSDLVQELLVDTSRRPFVLLPSRTMQTRERPFALALDEEAGSLHVATWGGETLDTLDLASGALISSVDLGYAQPRYPATNVERGEYFYYNADWSNNGRKACATCHIDELETDGLGFSNGAQAPTALHQVKPNHNLATTNSYFWNGSFGDGNYTSLAFFAQTRPNCQVVEFGLVEGPASDPLTRVGDPGNRFRSANDVTCRPVSAGPAALANQDAIDGVVAQEKALADQFLIQQTGFGRQALSRLIDLYSVAELRLAPNPLRQLYQAQQLAADVMSQIQQGRMLFDTAQCSTCHDPNDRRHPFTDGLDHGSGADWTQRFVNLYSNDPRLTGAIGSFSQTMLDAISPARTDHEVNIYLDPIDYFIPFCFELANCQEFDDPLTARGNLGEESRRLDLLVRFNLADPDRQFVPGNVRGQAKINTPSLRGVWTQAGLLHHALAGTFQEAILAPGHPALPAGQNGFAVDAQGSFDSHGQTTALTRDQIEALVRFVESIE
jgi:DNA-binding beta-propeller fold protein YncE/cytochrome c peroxidase